MKLPGRTLSPSIVGPDGSPALLIESIPVNGGERIVLTFVSTGPRWRQGVFIATEGALGIDGEEASHWTIWSDTAPAPVEINVINSDGAVTFYNVWDSDRGRGRESQSHTSGMYVEELSPTVRRYSCADIGVEPDFTSLVFTVETLES